MPDITIHHVRADDAGLLAFPSQDIFDGPLHAERLKQYLDRPCHFLFIALHRGMVVGMLMGVVHYHPDVETDFVVENFYVDRRFRGASVGRRLLSTARAEARARGCCTMLFTTTSDNASARRFMELSGFTEVPTVSYLQSMQELGPPTAETYAQMLQPEQAPLIVKKKRRRKIA